MFFRRKRTVQEISYDREKEEPVIRCSICTGEQVAGFRDLKTGRFREAALIKDEKDLEDFRAGCGVSGEIPKIY